MSHGVTLPLAAQACLGSAHVRHASVGFRMGVPSERVTVRSLLVNARVADRLTLSALSSQQVWKQPAANSRGYRFGGAIHRAGASPSICATVAYALQPVASLTVQRIAAGVALGREFRLSRSFSILPLIEPHIALRRATLTPFVRQSLVAELNGGVSLVRGAVSGGLRVEQPNTAGGATRLGWGLTVAFE